MDHQQASATYAVERYLLDELTPEERAEFEEHFFTCPECGEAVQAGTVFVDNARSVVREEASQRTGAPGKASNRVTFPGRFGRPVWSYGLGLAAALLLAITGYQNVREIPGLKQQLRELEAPHVLETATLRPQARGEKFTISAQSTPINLDLEMSNPSGPATYDVQIERESGETLYSIPNVIAQDGIIGLTFRPSILSPGEYEIVVRKQKEADGAGGVQEEVARYGFRIGR